MNDWPTKGTKLFFEGEGDYAFYRSAALWNQDYHAEAFKKAAEMLLDAHLASEPTPYRDEIFLPIVFLYRHCLELRLKDIVQIGDRIDICGPGDVKEALRGHSLARLWTFAKRAIVAHWPEGDKDTITAVESVINEFHQIDPNGQAFRYERDMTGKPYLHGKLPNVIDPEQLRRAVDSTYSFLDCTASNLYNTMVDMC